jgi:hypothetical protein
MMGVDLTLMPLMQRNFWASSDLICLERRRELWPAIEALNATPVPRPVNCFRARRRDGEATYGEVETNPYGVRLTWLTPADLLPLASHEGVTDNWRNRGIWALLAEMPPDWPVVLFWH